MKRIFLSLVVILFFNIAYADNKIYFDVSKNLQVIDMGGKKNISQVNEEFNGNFIDITAQEKVKEEQGKLIEKENAEKENLIQSKILELQRTEAIIELQKEGKLNNEGNVVKEIQ